MSCDLYSCTACDRRQGKKPEWGQKSKDEGEEGVEGEEAAEEQEEEEEE